MRSRIRILGLLGVITALALAACGGDEDTPTPADTRTPIIVAGTPVVVTATPAPTNTPAPTSTPAPRMPEGILNVVLNSLASENWNPRMDNPDHRPLWGALGDQLYGYGKTEPFVLDPSAGLVDSVDIDVQGSTVTMTVVIKSGIPFHFDEGIATADDVKYGFVEISKEGSANPSSGSYRKVINSDENNIEVVNDTTLRFNLQRDWVGPGLELNLGRHGGDYHGVIPMAYHQRVGEDGFTKRPISTGPWQFVDHRLDERVTLEAVPDHWRKAPEFATLRIFKVPESATRLAMLLAGQAHISDMTPLQAEQTQGNRDIKLLSYYAGQHTWLNLGGIINPDKDVYDSSIPWVGEDSFGEVPTKVRKAMNISIDREGIVAGILRGQGRALAVGITFDVPGAAWYNPAWKPYPYDPDLARQLMAEAGYPDGFDMNAWVFELGNAPLNDDIMVAVAGMWEKELGIKVNLKTAEYNPTVRQHFFSRTFGDHALTYSGTGVFLTFRAAQLVMCSTCPLAYFEVPEVDDLVAQLNATLDPSGPDGYNAITRKIGDVIYENHLTWGVVESKVFWGLRSDVVGDWDRTLFETAITDLEYVSRA